MLGPTVYMVICGFHILLEKGFVTETSDESRDSYIQVGERLSLDLF